MQKIELLFFQVWYNVITIWSLSTIYVFNILCDPDPTVLNTLGLLDISKFYIMLFLLYNIFYLILILF